MRRVRKDQRGRPGADGFVRRRRHMGRSSGTLVMMRVLILIIITLALLRATGSASRAQAQQDGRSSDDPSLWIEVRDERGVPLKNACLTVLPKKGERSFRQADR